VTRAVFFGSSDSVFSHRHFQALLEADCEIAAVVDVPPARRASTNSARQEGGTFVDLARGKGIPCFEPLNPNAAAFVEEMRGLAPDFFMAVGYMLLLKPPVLGIPRVVAANFHASLLPAYRGKHPVFWALRGGEPWCGLTVHEMSAGLDTGDILFQVRVPTKTDDSVSALYQRIMDASVPLVPALVQAVTTGHLQRTRQAEDGASYHGGTTEDDFRITWSMEAQRIARWVTATPGQCFVDLDGTRYFLLDAKVSSGEPEAGCCRVAAAGGWVELRRVRRRDGTVIPAHDIFPGGE
jgi:methionyl-tRNA formyltransferase